MLGESLTDGLKDIPVSAHECQGMMGIGYVGLGLNPYELTPEQRRETVWSVKVETFGEVRKHFNLSRRKWSLTNVAMALFTLAARGVSPDA